MASERHRRGRRRHQPLRRREPSGTSLPVAIGAARRGAVTEIVTSRPLRGPDGLKVVGATTLATAEGDNGGMAIVELSGTTGAVRTVSTGFDGVATFRAQGRERLARREPGRSLLEPHGPNGPDAKQAVPARRVPLALP
jgi:hypothetical protein